MEASIQPTDAAAASGTALLVAKGLTKSFPGVLAVDDVHLTIRAGEIVALLGQNGAGKSTLIQMLSGVHPSGSYAGQISLGGGAFLPSSVYEAEEGGVAYLPQEVNVAPDLSVAETVFLHDEPSRWGFLDVGLRAARTNALLTNFAVDVDAAAPMGSLDLVNQQLVLIVRALSKEARLIILDEPTAALTELEVTRLFGRLRDLARKGVAIIFVSHRLAEVFAISDRIVVMRDGRICGEHRTAETSREEIVADMVGRALGGVAPTPDGERGESALELRGLTLHGGYAEGAALVDGLDLDLARGEIVGLYGLLGSGCSEAAMAIFGAAAGRRSGQILLRGKRADIQSPKDAVRQGIGLIAQDRRIGLSAEHSIVQNAMLADLPDLSPYGLLDIASARRMTRGLVDKLSIKAASIDAEVATLSGGNQQKVQVARWLAAGAEVLILIDPTRGVDVGARQEIKRIWMDLKASGRALLLVSSDSEEMVELCDRALVLRAGHVVAELAGQDLTEHNLLRLAAGA
jgi:ABC-type sugar transport system ATPase subunit